MILTRLVPDFLKPILRPINKKLTYRPKSREELHQYWKQPWDGNNLAKGYLEGRGRSEFLVKLIKRTFINLSNER